MQRIDYADFLPLFPEETEAAIRARMNAWANEGLSGGDPRIRDVREGSFFQIVTEGSVRLAAQLYDRMSEALAMSNALIAGGYYLDLLATSRGLPRIAATNATGQVLFTGPDTTPIPAGTRVSASAPIPGDPAISFETDSPAAISGTTVTVNVTAVDPGVAGNVAASAIVNMDTPIAGVTVTNPTPLANGSETEDDDHLAQRVISSFRSTGGANIETVRGWALAYPTVGRATVRPNFYGPGTALLIVSTTDGSPVSGPTLVGLQDEIDPPTMTTTLSAGITLPVATIPVVSTTGARPATVGAPDYINVDGQIVTYTGMDATHFTGCAGGSGVVASGAEVSQEGAGAGLAPIGMYVKVETAALRPIDIVAEVHPSSGYGVATSGLTDVTNFIQTALASYVDGVTPGSSIILAQVFARIAEAQGVDDVDWASLTVDGTHGNVAIDDDPPQKPYLRTLTLTAF